MTSLGCDTGYKNTDHLNLDDPFLAFIKNGNRLARCLALGP